MEDSSFQGWTSPPGHMPYPEGRKPPESPHPKNFIGEIRSQTKATDDSIKYALRHWPRRYLEDFVIEGRTWTDYATKTEYRLVHGNPLAGLGLDGDTSAADCFVESDGQLLFLRPADADTTCSIAVGAVGWSRRR